jgi:hypothetical protein
MRKEDRETARMEIDPVKFLELQYVALREEILETKRQNFQIIGFGIASWPAGNLIAIRYSETLFLVLPVIVIVAAFLYLGSNNAVIRCGNYIRENMEPGTVIGWERWLEEKEGLRRKADKTTSLAIRLLFGVYLIVSLALAWRELDKLLVAVAGFFVMSLYILVSLFFAYRFIAAFNIYTSRSQ